MDILLRPMRYLTRLYPEITNKTFPLFNISEIFRISEIVLIFDLRKKTYFNYKI